MLSLFKPRADKRRRVGRGSIPRWFTGSSSPASAPRPQTHHGVIFIPEMPVQDDGCQDGDEGDELESGTDSTRSCLSVFSSASAASSMPTRSRSAQTLALGLKRRGSRLQGLVHRALHYDKPQRRPSTAEALESRVSMSSSTSEASMSASKALDECPEAEEDAAGGKVEFLFFAGCPDNLNMYELEVNQYRRRTNFVSGGSTADKREPHRLQPTSDSISVGPTIVHSMPPLFAPHLRQSVSSNLLAKTDRDDYSGAHTW